MEGSVQGEAEAGSSIAGKVGRKEATTVTKHVNLGTSSGADLKNVTVVKRDGMIVPFRRDRISNAIEAAFRASNQIPLSSPLPQDTYSTVQHIADAVIEQVRQQAASGASLTVEGIQDIVELKIMESGHHEVARGYIIYRDERKVLRDNSPRNIKILRRDMKTTVRFNPMKIAAAIERGFRATLHIAGQTPADIIAAVNQVTTKIVTSLVQKSHEGTALHIEMIQDEVERQLMAEGFYNVAKDYILYRATRATLRQQEESSSASASVESATTEIKDSGRTFEAISATGEKFQFTEAELRRRLAWACRGYESLVSIDQLIDDTTRNYYDGIRADEIDASVIMAVRGRMEKDPAYSFIAARLLLDGIYRETFGVEASSPKLKEAHKAYFKEYLKKAIAVDRVSPDLMTYDLNKIGDALVLERDLQFNYLGLQTLYDRYLIHSEEKRLETPQIFWMRVSMGLALQEGAHKNERAIEFYNVLSKFLFVSSTPTLFNSGTLHPQLSSCYLSTVMDDLKHIFKVVSDDAMLSKWAGGLGNDWTNVRATGSRIKGTNGRSQGVIPFLKVANDTAVAVNQGGKRKGAMCAYLETWHLDIEDFLELRKNTGDDRRRTHDMNTANWIPDLFMKRVSQNGQWTLFSPSDAPDLHDLYGRAFEKRYEEYEAMAARGEMKLFKKVEALALWRKMLSMLFETGHPWMTFKDPSNIRSPQSHVGVVHSSNLCTEILLNTSVDEIAVCNLGSVNLLAHVTEKGLDEAKVASTVKTAVRMLDNVIDINFYPTPEAKNANLRHRPIGLGIMGFQDCLFACGISYASPEAVSFADKSMEMVSYYAILASTELAKERGTYATYKGSKWDKGLLPIDTIKLLAEERGAEFVDMDTSSTLAWDKVRAAVKQHGMRNSNTMAIAPTATISNITGVNQSIEPTYKQLYVKSNLSGEFTVHNPFLVDALKKAGIWDDEMIDDLKYFDGSILEIERIPDAVKRVFLSAFEIEPEWIIECGSRRQKWIDMGQSLNLYIAQPSGKKLHDMYVHAWKKGLKTTYYLRSLGATQIEKSTTDINRRGIQPRWMKNKSASNNIKLNRPDEPAPVEAAPVAAAKPEMPKVCGLDGECESCQ